MKKESLMSLVPAGTYVIGTDSTDGFPTDKEGPQVIVTVEPFMIDQTTVTNEEFARFVKATNYVTEAENFGWSYVFHYFLSEEQRKKTEEVPGLSWWLSVPGANWRCPEGPDSTISKRLEHPVVHVSRNDALAYCQWVGKRLPTEAEWEISAKGGTSFERYPWGDDFLKNGQHHCNIWQGQFPISNSLEDGFAATAPARHYEPNGYGVYQMIGNVWEWCLNPRGVPLSEFQQVSGREYWGCFQEHDDNSYALRGGSFLCHQSYCKRYRIAARNGNTGMSTSNNMGFRCVKDL